MSKPSAEQFSLAGDKYLGRSYAEMDCQGFVERCMRDVGIKKDLAGSNAWFRYITWTGTPEECKRQFGSIPKGALLFIWADDGGEKARGYKDGLGNASHIGIYTGRGKGALNSSKSKGGVCESKFEGKAIRGGWNMVGLWDAFDYGDVINALLAGGQPDDKGGDTMQTATVTSPNGGKVNLRKARGKHADLVNQLTPGTKVDVVTDDGEWCYITTKKGSGYIMREYLAFDATDTDAAVTYPASPDYLPAGNGLDDVRAALTNIRDQVDALIVRLSPAG